MPNLLRVASLLVLALAGARAVVALTLTRLEAASYYYGDSHSRQDGAELAVLVFAFVLLFAGSLVASKEPLPIRVVRRAWLIAGLLALLTLGLLGTASLFQVAAGQLFSGSYAISSYSEARAFMNAIAFGPVLLAITVLAFVCRWWCGTGAYAERWAQAKGAAGATAVWAPYRRRRRVPFSMHLNLRDPATNRLARRMSVLEVSPSGAITLAHRHWLEDVLFGQGAEQSRAQAQEIRATTGAVPVGLSLLPWLFPIVSRLSVAYAEQASALSALMALLVAAVQLCAVMVGIASPLLLGAAILLTLGLWRTASLRWRNAMLGGGVIGAAGVWQCFESGRQILALLAAAR